MFKIMVIFMMAILATGCASITGSKNQPVSVSAVCNGAPVNLATCTLMNDKGSWYSQTPGSVMVQKAWGDLAVDCKKEQSYGNSKFESSANLGVWGNIVFGGLIGFAIDASSGAGFDYPSNMMVSLNQPCPEDKK